MKEKKRPNILFLLSDDQGYWSLGSYGNSEARTPVLDKLAQDGIRFDNFYCASPVCSPARASILTGRMPSQHGVVDWLGGGAVNKEDYKDIRIPREIALHQLADGVDPATVPDPAPFSVTRNYQRYMNFERGPIDYLEGMTTYTELLAKSGYRCGLAGKWHLGNAACAQKGFSFWQVVPRGGTPYRMPERIRDGKISIEFSYVTDDLADDAIRFLDTQPQDQPFYLSVHYTAPHDPWRQEDHPAELWRQFDGCAFRSVPDGPLHPDQVAKRPHPKNDAERREMVQAFFTAVSGMDRSIGRILTALSDRGMLDDTIVVFTADNGLNLGHHGVWGKGNGTFPLNLFESSVRVPCLIWGKSLAHGAVRKGLYSHYDLFPTLLDLAGCGMPDGLFEALPGRSLLPALTSDKETGGDVVVLDEYGPARMIRSGDWKLIYRYPYGPHELYNLAEDPDERHNRMDEPDALAIRRTLLGRMEAWFRTYGSGPHDARLFPVDGEGQMARLSSFGDPDTTVFKRF